MGVAVSFVLNRAAVPRQKWRVWLRPEYVLARDCPGGSGDARRRTQRKIRSSYAGVHFSRKVTTRQGSYVNSFM